MLSLTSDLPSSILSRILGIHISTAVVWVRFIERDRAALSGARASGGDGRKADDNAGSLADHCPVTRDLQSFALSVVVPDQVMRGSTVEVRPRIEGRDIVAEAFDDGPCEDPRHLLFPDGPLRADVSSREVRLAEATCTEGCCGALYVTIRRDGDQVIWGAWRNPDAVEVGLPEFRFDAQQYHAEVERATLDRSWEWPARTVARLLEEELRRRTAWLERWECELASVSAWLWEPDQINLFFFHPGGAAVKEDRPWLQFRMTLNVSGGDPAAQAQQLAEELTAFDPRLAADVCGGSPEFARQLGYPWPQRHML